MGSTVIPVTPTGSLDRFGLSIATAARSAADPRAGAIYHPADFAAAVPVHFHPLGGSRYLGLFDRYWSAGTPASGAAGRYSAHTTVNAPAAAVVDAALGTAAVVTGAPGYALGFRLPTWSTARLVGAASASRFVYLLLSTNLGAVLSIWRLDPDDRFVAVAQVPIADLAVTGGVVRFDKGVYLDGPHLYLWGADTVTHAVYTARAFASTVAAEVVWDYQGDTGWHSSGATPVTGLSSVGPMSTVVFRSRTYLTTVALTGGTYVGQVWASHSMADPWTLVSSQVINASADWLGNGLMLQPQVTVNYAALPTGARAAIPMTWTQASSVGGAGLDVRWDLLAITA